MQILECVYVFRYNERNNKVNYAEKEIPMRKIVLSVMTICVLLLTVPNLVLASTNNKNEIKLNQVYSVSENNYQKKTEYWFTPKKSGTYRLTLDNQNLTAKKPEQEVVDVEISDQSDSEGMGVSYGTGYTCTRLEAGHEYKITVLNGRKYPIFVFGTPIDIMISVGRQKRIRQNINQ